jgi:ABC-type transporter Mla subunit MlaD
MSTNKIEISETSIRIVDVLVPGRDVAKYVLTLPADEREQAIVHAVEVGVFCLERARAGQSLDFVRREIDALLNSLQRAVEKIPEDTQKQLTSKIGTAEGQVLAPLRTLVDHVSEAATDKIQEIRKLLQDDIDPTKGTSSLGKALGALRDLLDSKRSDSIQGSLEAAVKHATAESGPLAKAVRDVVAETLKPLEGKIVDLAKEVRGQAAAEEALEQTTKKGTTYEEEVVQALQSWGRGTGFEVHHVGTDNQPGDVLLVSGLSSGAADLRIVVEARDRQQPMGRIAISDTLNTAMAERRAGASIYISKARDGLAKEIGEWAEGTIARGRWVACTNEHLITAVRFLIVQQQFQTARAAVPSVDATAIQAQIQRIRTTLGRIKTVNTRITDLRDGADEIQREVEAVRDEIRDALSDVEGALRRTGRETPELHA